MTEADLIKAIQALDERWMPYNAEYAHAGEFRKQLLDLLGVKIE